MSSTVVLRVLFFTQRTKPRTSPATPHPLTPVPNKVNSTDPPTPLNILAHPISHSPACMLMNINWWAFLGFFAQICTCILSLGLLFAHLILLLVSLKKNCTCRRPHRPLFAPLSCARLFNTLFPLLHKIICQTHLLVVLHYYCNIFDVLFSLCVIIKAIEKKKWRERRSKSRK